jgi:NTP pyrophosphatase (non-canonical NTP hydrolase)
MDHDTFKKLYKIVDGLNKRFPGGDDSFRILARLMEESGELAAEIHHFEGLKGHRRQDPPDKDHLAKECMDIMTAVLHVAKLYGVENELNARIDKHYTMVVSEGLVEPLE